MVCVLHGVQTVYVEYGVCFYGLHYVFYGVWCSLLCMYCILYIFSVPCMVYVSSEMQQALTPNF